MKRRTNSDEFVYTSFPDEESVMWMFSKCTPKQKERAKAKAKKEGKTLKQYVCSLVRWSPEDWARPEMPRMLW